MSDNLPVDVLDLTSQIVSAHVSNNSVAPDALPLLIQAVYRSLASAGKVEAAPSPSISLADTPRALAAAGLGA